MARLLQYSFVALVVTTWTFVSFIYSSRPEDGEANALSSLMRTPASIPGELPRLALVTPKRGAEPITMNTVEFKCLDRVNGDSQTTSARWVRLAGKGCGKLNIEAVEIRNLSNGYSATLFATAKRGLTTDYIPLLAGENKISLKYKDASGSLVEHQFSIARD